MAWLLHCDSCGNASAEEEPVGWILLAVVQAEHQATDLPFGFLVGRERKKKRWTFCSADCLAVFASLEREGAKP